ncbi:MAG: ATP-binding protein [Actinomycetota bacterium]|nr:ATP-binding protein [Actinomycetota bacterium]
MTGTADADPSLDPFRALARLAALLCQAPAAELDVTDSDHAHGFTASEWRHRVAEVSPLGADGEALQAIATTPLLGPSGHVLGQLRVLDTAAHDLTSEQLDGLRALAGQAVQLLQLRRCTVALDAARRELSRYDELLAGFAGRLSHDLKSPLTAVMGFAETLTMLPAVNADERAVRFADRIVSGGHRMRAMIDDLVEFASIGPPRLQRVDVTKVVDEVLADLADVVADTGAVVEVHPAPLEADVGQLRTLLRHLLLNAIAYRDPDGPCRVEVRATAVGGDWAVQVVDHGPGIPAEDAERVLQPLTRLPAAARVPGSGMGLAVCRRIAVAHGGTLRIAETPGGGATVTATGDSSAVPRVPCAG